MRLGRSRGEASGSAPAILNDPFHFPRERRDFSAPRLPAPAPAPKRCARMRAPPPRLRDPLAWQALLALAFATLAFWRLTTPSAPYFDEIHYLPAARSLIDLSQAINLEHPPLGKQLIALGMLIAGDNPLGWRIMPLAFGTLALFAAMRAMWFASCSRTASLLTGIYLATGFPLLVHARIAMLDIFMLTFVLVALWMCAAAWREPETGRRRLALAGAALGAAMASKWNAIPLAVLPGLIFLALRIRDTGTRFLITRRGAPVPGITLGEAFLWLGVVPLAVYALSFWPFLLFEQTEHVLNEHALPQALVALHQQMLQLQTTLKTPHPYESIWLDWVINRRPIWYLYEQVDGAQRGVLMIGNPLTMLAALPALAWCAYAAIRRGRADCASVVILYAASLGLWMVAPKPVQFYFHYLLPGTFALAALALTTEALWRRGDKAMAGLLVAGAIGLAAFFHPILTAAPLEDGQAFRDWAWFESWR